MRPIRQGNKGPDQCFSGSERLYKRVPPEQLTLNGEIEPSLIQCSFGKTIPSAPSVVRSKYATVRDVLHPAAADGKNVSNHAVFFLTVDNFPGPFEAGDKRVFRFYAFHEPNTGCYAHSVLACCTLDSEKDIYTQPSTKVRNMFKAQLVAVLNKNRASVSVFPNNYIEDLKKVVAAFRAPKLGSSKPDPLKTTCSV
jgi:hypothetical protein